MSTVSRIEKIKGAVDEVLFDIGGLEPDEIIADATFLDLGFDSLFLTQASTALRKKFGVKVTFRQLMEETSTPGSLIQFLDSKVTADQYAVASTPIVSPVEKMTALSPETQATEPRVAEPQMSHANGTVQLGQPELRQTLSPESTAPQPMPLPEKPVGASVPASGGTSLERIVQVQLQQMQSLMITQLQMVGGQRVAAPPPQVSQPLPSVGQTESAIAPEPVPQPPAVHRNAAISAVSTNGAHRNEPHENSPGKANHPSSDSQHPKSDAKSGTSFGPWKPLNKGASDDFTPVQRQFIDELIDRYTSRTAKSKAMTTEHRAVHADPRAVSGFKAVWKEMTYPIVAERSAGAHLWDVDGNKYVDLQSGFGSSLFGHSPEFVTDAIKAQLERGVHIGPQMDSAGETALKISQLIGHERVTFCNTGSEAVMAAMRIARTVTGRDLIVTFSGDYHGQFNEVLVRGVVRRGETRTLPIAPGIPSQSVENMLLLDFGDAESLRILNERADEIAAVLVEPIQSRHPEVQPREFLQQLRKWTADNEVCLIFDEVITGFRLTQSGAQGWYDIQADMASYGKVIGGGMPIGLLAGKAEYMDALDGGQWSYGDDSVPEVGVTYFAGTFVRHPLVVAAANAVADHLIENPSLQANLNQRASQFADRLNVIFREISAPIFVENCGSMLYFAFQEPTETDELFFFKMREEGIHIMSARAFFLTTAHSDDDLDRVCTVVRSTTIALQNAGFLSRNGLPHTHSLSASTWEVGGVEGPFPLTDDQSGLWLASQLSDLANCSYNESILVKLSGPLDVGIMHQAVRETIQRHDSYFLSFASDGLSQRVSGERKINIRTFDFSVQENPTASLEKLVESEAQTPFNLERGLLIRVNFVQMAAQEWQIHFVAHHIATDGFSSSVLLDEIRTLYGNLVAGETTAAEPATHFRQYVAENSQLAQSRDGQESLQYWLTELAELPDPLALPGDRSRPARKTYQGDAVKWSFDSALIESVRTVARKQQTTMFNFMLSAFNAFLARLTGQNDIVVGVPMAGQALYDMMDLTGFCVHFLPLRTRIKVGQSFGDLLSSTQSKMLEGREYQPCALGNIIRAMQLPHDASRTPITDIAFNLDRPVSSAPIGGVAMSVDVAPKKAVAWDIFLNLTDTGDTLIADCEFNTDILEAETVIRWLSSFQTLLEDVVADPTQSINTISLLSAEERQKLLVEWNQTDAPYRRDVCLHQLFEEQALRTPKATAAIFPDQEVTYAELRTSANRLANYLRAKGGLPGTLVGIYVDRSPQMLSGILGTMIAGAAYVPLDPNYPAERLAYIIQDAQISLLLTTSDLFDSLPANDAEVIQLDLDWAEIEARSDETPENVNSSEDTAFVVYTSGSTGKPKGVKAIHRSHVNRYEWMWNAYPFEDGEVCCQKTSLNFIDHSWEIYGPLLAGVPSVYIPDSTVKQPLDFLEVLAKHNVTRVILVPAHLRSLLDAFNDLDKRLPHLKLWTASGEAVTVELAQQFRKQLPDRTMLNLYGMSEVGIDVTYYELANDIPLASIPIGRPVANGKAYILDSTRQPVPLGVVGEIYAGGEILSGGYLHQPQMTDERFLPDPFIVEAAGSGKLASFADIDPAPSQHEAVPMVHRMYKTGDLGRFRPDGMIEYVGRADHQIKIRGFRVELGEIEATLLAHPGVQQCIVMARETGLGGTTLVGYVLRSEKAATSDIEPNDLKQHLERTLPDYMIPAHIVILETLPLTPNGKVNRIALQDIAFDEDEAEDQVYVAPSTEIERRLVSMWESLLGVNSVGIEDNFFERGGHSLLAVRLFAQIRDLTGDNLPLSVLFDAPTIASLTKHLTPLPEESPETELESESEQWAPLVLINRGDANQKPFFCIHGGGGNVLNFRDLSSYLGDDLPFYGIQAKGVDGVLRPHATIDEMATCYLEAIQSAQPQGPYRLGGYSGGGVVACEIAMRLEEEGQEVELVAMIDTFRPGLQARGLSIGSHLKNFSSKGAGYLTDRWKGRAHSKQLEQERSETVERALAENAPIPIEVRDWYLTTNFINALASYTPKVYNGPVAIFSAIDLWPIYAHIGEDRGWRELLPKLEIEMVPGDHDTLVIGENVKVLATKLRDRLLRG